MSPAEHYFENLLMYGRDINGDPIDGVKEEEEN